MNNLGILLIVGFVFGTVSIFGSIIYDSIILLAYSLVLISFTLVVFFIAVLIEWNNS